MRAERSKAADVRRIPLRVAGPVTLLVANTPRSKSDVTAQAGTAAVPVAGCGAVSRAAAAGRSGSEPPLVPRASAGAAEWGELSDLAEGPSHPDRIRGMITTTAVSGGPGQAPLVAQTMRAAEPELAAAVERVAGPSPSGPPRRPPSLRRPRRGSPPRPGAQARPPGRGARVAPPSCGVGPDDLIDERPCGRSAGRGSRSAVPASSVGGDLADRQRVPERAGDRTVHLGEVATTRGGAAGRPTAQWAAAHPSGLV